MTGDVVAVIVPVLVVMVLGEAVGTGVPSGLVSPVPPGMVTYCSTTFLCTNFKFCLLI